MMIFIFSDYFASMFTHDLCEAKKDEIEIHEVNPDSLMWLIRYMYTSHIDIREDNVEDLLITSRLLQINKVVEGSYENDRSVSFNLDDWKIALITLEM